MARSYCNGGAVLFALLAFQIALGLQPALASAATAQGVHSSGGVCTAHGQAAHDHSGLKHDCCKSSGCQCHCGNLSLALNLSIAQPILEDGPLLRPAPTTRAPSAPSDTHFRPPIAL